MNSDRLISLVYLHLKSLSFLCADLLFYFVQPSKQTQKKKTYGNRQMSQRYFQFAHLFLIRTAPNETCRIERMRTIKSHKAMRRPWRPTKHTHIHIYMSCQDVKQFFSIFFFCCCFYVCAVLLLKSVCDVCFSCSFALFSSFQCLNSSNIVRHMYVQGI